MQQRSAAAPGRGRERERAGGRALGRGRNRLQASLAVAWHGSCPRTELPPERLGFFCHSDSPTPGKQRRMWGRKGEGEERRASGAQRRSEARAGAPGEAGAGPARTGGAGMEPEGPRPTAASGAWKARLVWLRDLFSQRVGGHRCRGPARVAPPQVTPRGERRAQRAARHRPRKRAEPRPGGGARARAHALAPSVPAEAPAGAVPRAVPALKGSRSLCALRAAHRGPVAAPPQLPVSEERCPGISAEKAAPSPHLPT